MFITVFLAIFFIVIGSMFLGGACSIIAFVIYCNVHTKKFSKDSPMLNEKVLSAENMHMRLREGVGKLVMSTVFLAVAFHFVNVSCSSKLCVIVYIIVMIFILIIVSKYILNGITNGKNTIENIKGHYMQDESR